MGNISVLQRDFNGLSNFHQTIQERLSGYVSKTTDERGNFKSEYTHTDYFIANDVWHIKDLKSIPNFKQEFEKYGDKNVVNLRFNAVSESIKLEMKLIWYQKLFSDEWGFVMAFQVGSPLLRYLTDFINSKYSYINSILELEQESANTAWMHFIEEKGLKLYRKNSSPAHKGKLVARPVVHFFNKSYKYLSDITDSQDEWDKDEWDIRILSRRYGIPYNDSISGYHLKLKSIENIHFRNQYKRYCKQRLLGKNNFSWSTAKSYTNFITPFLNFISETEPMWNSLKKLERKHIEMYIQRVTEYAHSELKQTNKHPTRHIYTSLSRISRYIEDLQRYEYEGCPDKSIRHLIFDTDRPKSTKSMHDVKDIPDFVLEQVFKHMDDMSDELRPIIFLSLWTGLRISDVLSLTYNCLIKINGEYYIETRIQKTYIEGHRCPIDAEMAAFLKERIKKTKHISNIDNNPNGYLFVRTRGSRKGRGFSQAWVSRKLNEYAKKHHIVDEIGNPFHFKLHQFRHTYAMKLIDSGADFFTVQQLLAHQSPEMTMVYVKLRDSAKRDAFENALKKGVFSFDYNGKIQEVQPDDNIPENILEALWLNHKLTAIDNPYGTCQARLTGDCPYAETPPCLTCNGGSPCKDLAIGLSEFDKQKYEILVNSTVKTISTLQQMGRNDVAKKNAENLERYKDILSKISEGNVIYGRLNRIN